ncbi:MAG: indole-3-glycerol phosphate synthase TrpC [Rikenellaceae bacterium]
MEDILHKIVENKRVELSKTNFDGIEQRARECKRVPISMANALRTKKGGIIAEFKRKSPSKGWINQDGNPIEVVKGYSQAGAAACSILTDKDFFGGDINDLIAARSVAGDTPLLRKEFIIDPRQIYQARVAGADAVLLIAACLTKEECAELASVAHSVGLEVLLEVHAESELEYVSDDIDMLGVNNRNLGSFKTDINNSFMMASKMRATNANVVLVSESGIDGVGTIKELQNAGFEGFLIGESFMKRSNPAQVVNQVINEL